MNDRPEPIQVTLVPEDRRLSVPEKLFGHHFLAIENAVYYFANNLSPDYQGGYWDFYTLSNGGFYMTPSGTDSYHLSCDNFFEGDLLANAFGITCCFYAYSHLSFSEDEGLSALCTRHYHWLREAILDHPDGGKIFAATD
jgi:hypothetical protein